MYLHDIAAECLLNRIQKWYFTIVETRGDDLYCYNSWKKSKPDIKNLFSCHFQQWKQLQHKNVSQNNPLYKNIDPCLLLFFPLIQTRHRSMQCIEFHKKENTC